MTDFDLLCLSLGLNLGLLYYQHRLFYKYKELSYVFAQLMSVMNGLADSELVIHRDSEGNIRVKDKPNGK